MTREPGPSTAARRGALLVPKPLIWRRGPARIEGGVIELHPDAKSGLLTASPEMVLELSRIRRPQEVNTFMRKFGPLRVGDTDAPKPWRESWDDWEEIANELTMVMDVYASVVALEARRELDPAERPDIGTEREHLRNKLRRALEPAVSADKRMDFMLSDRYDAARQLRVATKWIAHVLTTRTDAVRQELVAAPEPEPAHHFALVLAAPTLADLVWQQLGLMVATRAPTAVCAECDRVYLQTREGRKYCSEQCGNRYRGRSKKRRTEPRRQG